MDSSVEGGYAAAVHQIPKNVMRKENLSSEDVLNGRHNIKLERPVIYFSKQLNKYEVHYWPIELEIAGIVWTVQKLCHLIEGCPAVKIFTDHSPAADILTSKILKTSSSVRMNLRLIRASQFLSQFPNIIIVHRPGKDHINADALSRLVQLRTDRKDLKEEEGGVYGFMTTVVGMSMATLRLLEDGYVKDRHLSLIYDNVKRRMDTRDSLTGGKDLTDLGKDSTDLLKISPGDAVVTYKSIQRIDTLAPDEIEYNGFQGRKLQGHIMLYIIDPIDKHPRLCIPSNCHKMFFETAHDKNTHAGFHKAYSELRQNYYIKNLSRSLRSYISSCPFCQQNNTLRHRPYGKLQPTEAPESPIQMVTLDLITKLPESKLDGISYDSMMTITDKLTKMVTLIIGREN